MLLSLQLIPGKDGKYCSGVVGSDLVIFFCNCQKKCIWNLHPRWSAGLMAVFSLTGLETIGFICSGSLHSLPIPLQSVLLLWGGCCAPHFTDNCISLFISYFFFCRCRCHWCLSWGRKKETTSETTQMNTWCKREVKQFPLCVLFTLVRFEGLILA